MTSQTGAIGEDSSSSFELQKIIEKCELVRLQQTFLKEKLPSARWSLFPPYSRSLDVVRPGWNGALKCGKPRLHLSRCSAVLASFRRSPHEYCWSSSCYFWKEGTSGKSKPLNSEKCFPQSYLSHSSQFSLMATASCKKQWEMASVPGGPVPNLE